MRIVVVAPPHTGNLWLKCLLGRLYGLKQLPSSAAPPRADPAAFRAWAAEGNFPDGTILHTQYNFSPDLAAAMAETPAHVVTIVRDPYDVFATTYRAAQTVASTGGTQRVSTAVAGMAAKPLDHPDVQEYIAVGFRGQLLKMEAWLQSGLAIPVRFEDLRDDPDAELTRLTERIRPAGTERVRRAVTSCQASAVTDSANGSDLGDPVLRAIWDRYDEVVMRIGYDTRRPSDLEVPEDGGEEAPDEEDDDALLPPFERMRFRYARNTGRQGFLRVGNLLLQRFIKECGLRPEDDVLDVGSGVGRVAVALTTFLLPTSRYEGFDIDAEGIAWCQANLTPRHPNFRFQLADIYNKQYHPEGRQRAAEFRFPYDDAGFDFAFLTSVFTHMLPADVEHYLRELRRVLRPGGRVAVTMFVHNDAARADIARGASVRTFPHDHGVYRVQDAEVPEHAVAYDETYLRRAFAAAGLPIRDPIGFGGWSRRKETGHGQQDFVVALRAE